MIVHAPSTEYCPTLGDRVADELGRRGLRGAFFDFPGYRALSRANSAATLQDFFDARGYHEVRVSADPAAIVDELQAEWLRHSSRRIWPLKLLYWAVAVWQLIVWW